jgi:hypothetical protein
VESLESLDQGRNHGQFFYHTHDLEKNFRRVPSTAHFHPLFFPTVQRMFFFQMLVPERGASKG